MNKEVFIKMCDEKLKLVRTEVSYSQEKMALALGISKKTLVEIEKGRSSLGWQGCVTLCALFPKSDVIVGTFGGVPTDMILAFAFEGDEPSYTQTMGGMVWWTEKEKKGEYHIQQNIISKHYRILDGKDRRICASLEYEKILEQLQQLAEKGGHNE